MAILMIIMANDININDNGNKQHKQATTYIIIYVCQYNVCGVVYNAANNQIMKMMMMIMVVMINGNK